MAGFHLLAFGSSSLDATAGNVKLNAIAEQLFLINNNNFRMPSNHKIQFAYGGGLVMTRGRIVAPHFRVPNVPQIVQVNPTAVVPTLAAIMDFRDNPLELFNNEEVSVEVTTTGVAAASVAFLGVTAGELDQAIPRMDLRWARFTATPTGVAFGWSARAEITFEDTIDSGVYGVYGLIATGTTQLATRLIFNNQYMRPGIIGGASSDIQIPKIFDRGLGQWGTFENSTPPGIEVLNSAAGAVTISGLMLMQLLHRQ